jgi:hypothetical protein
MRYKRRWAFSATVIGCALVMGSSPTARAGSVCRRSDDDRPRFSSEHCRQSEWISQILDDDDRTCAREESPGTPPMHVSYLSEVSDNAGGGHAAVIPLPAPLWSGMSGLGALAFAGAVRKLRRTI